MKWIGNDDFEKFSQFFSKYPNDDIAPLTSIEYKMSKRHTFNSYAKVLALNVLSEQLKGTQVRTFVHFCDAFIKFTSDLNYLQNYSSQR